MSGAANAGSGRRFGSRVSVFWNLLCACFCSSRIRPTSADGNAVVSFSKGALFQPTVVSVRAWPQTEYPMASDVYRFEPSGTRFAAPVELKLRG